MTQGITTNIPSMAPWDVGRDLHSWAFGNKLLRIGLFAPILIAQIYSFSMTGGLLSRQSSAMALFQGVAAVRQAYMAISISPRLARVNDNPNFRADSIEGIEQIVKILSATLLFCRFIVSLTPIKWPPELNKLILASWGVGVGLSVFRSAYRTGASLTTAECTLEFGWWAATLFEVQFGPIQSLLAVSASTIGIYATLWPTGPPKKKS